MVEVKNKGSKGLLIAAICIFAVSLYIILTFITAKPIIEFSSGDSATVEVFKTYSDEEVVASVKFPLLFGAKAKLSVEKTGVINTNVLGPQNIEYETSYLGKKTSAVRTVTVVDTTPPIISFEEDFYVYGDDNPINEVDDVKFSFAASDNYEGELTQKVEKKIEGALFILTVCDSSGNTARAEVKLIKADNTGPDITLNGNSTIFLPINTKYEELGFTVSDDSGVDMTDRVKINNQVNMQKNGTYPVTYTVFDDAGNVSTVVRKVVVYGGANKDDYDTVDPNGKVIYLTFDDGPGAYTEELLGILENYGVKATFFVTNQFPKYEYVIGKIHEAGHVVAVHTATHDWSIYDSVENYLKDFNKMNAIIEKYTGAPTRFFRFPGGTSNTVSKSHCKGIMTKLSQLMTESGYIYYDWNVGSEDTSLTDPSAIINKLIGQVKNRKNSVILCHDIKKHTIAAMPGFIEYGLKNGYTFKVISEETPTVQFKPNN